MAGWEAVALSPLICILLPAVLYAGHGHGVAAVLVSVLSGVCPSWQILACLVCMCPVHKVVVFPVCDVLTCGLF